MAQSLSCRPSNVSHRFLRSAFRCMGVPCGSLGGCSFCGLRVPPSSWHRSPCSRDLRRHLAGGCGRNGASRRRPQKVNKLLSFAAWAFFHGSGLPVLVSIQPLRLRKHRNWRIPRKNPGVLLQPSTQERDSDSWCSLGSKLEGNPKRAGSVLQDLLRPLVQRGLKHLALRGTG